MNINNPESFLTEVPKWARNLFPDKPLGFIRESHPLVGDYCYRCITRKIFVICSASVENDGKRWIHVSCSSPSRVPKWDDLLLVKDTFIGDRKAIQVFPKKSEYVNYAKTALHLWACLDEDNLPDFRKGGMI